MYHVFFKIFCLGDEESKQHVIDTQEVTYIHLFLRTAFLSSGASVRIIASAEFLANLLFLLV